MCMQRELIREMKMVFWTFEIGNCHSVVDQLSCWWYSVAMLNCLHTRVNRFGNQLCLGLGFCQMTAEKTVSGARNISALRVLLARTTDSKLHKVREPQVGMS